MAPPGPATRLLPPLVLALAGVARGTFTVVAWPRVAVVAFGGSVAVNCSHSACPGDNDGDKDGDKATLGLETPLEVTPGPGGSSWQSFELRNVSLWRPGDVTCAGKCGDSEARASTGVMVYQLPQRVALEPVAPVAVGDSTNLTCHVLEVAPLRNLTVTLRRGAETLRTQSFGDTDGSASVAVTHALTVTRGDHGQDVTCHAELSLRPHGPLFARAAVPVTLSVFALPDPPHLQAPSLLEAGTVTNVTCRVTGAFPAGDTRVTMALDGAPLDVTVAVSGDTVTATAALSPPGTGTRELRCQATVGTGTRTASRDIHVYSLPAPRLQLSPAVAVAGSAVTVTCHAGATGPPQARLRLLDGTGATLAQGPQPRDVTDVTLTQGPQLVNVTGATLAESPRARDVTGATPAKRPQPHGVTGATPTKRPQPHGVTLTEGPQFLNVTGATPAQGPQPHDVTLTQSPQPHGVTGATLTQGPQPHGVTLTEGPPPDAVTLTQGPQPHGVTGATPAQGPQPRLRARVVAQRRHHGQRFRCRATLRVGDTEVTKEAEARLEVLYPPELSPGGCPSSRTWLRGSRERLWCHAGGNPAPNVTCGRRGVPEATTEPREVTAASAGSYECRATNALGTQSRSVTVRVEYEPSLSESGCPARRVWLEGQRWQLWCHAEGDPPPRTRCHRHGDTRDSDSHHGDTQHGDIQHGDIQHGDIQHSGTQHSGTQHDDIRYSDTQHSGTQHGGTQHSGTQHGGTRVGGIHNDTHDSDTWHSDTHDGGTQHGDIQHGDIRYSDTHHSDTHDGGTHHSDTQHSGTQHSGTRDNDTHDNDTRDNDTHDSDTQHRHTQHGDTHDNDTQHSDTQHDDSQHSGTHDGGTQQGGVPRGGRVVTRADGGHYVCRATNRHGVAERSVLVTVESPPRLSELGCPARRRWLEGTPARLGCAASGTPRPRVTCHKVGDKSHPRGATGANVTRGDAGTYRCRATNAHGSAERNVSVRVEYAPSAVTLRALPSARIPRGSAFTLDCSAEGIPPPTLTWGLPEAPNLHLSPDNTSVTVTGATAANRGRYTCTASNRHGRGAASLVLRVDESWLVALVALGALGGAVMMMMAAAAGYYMKSTACKKGEYNVRDAEGSSEAACLHRHREERGAEVFGIQLTQP